ncbi:hypothetical protein IIA95_01760 [Patescibacteria group bacterium]|nr:hypothetical protein [Patescibacteria group bacterium]
MDFENELTGTTVVAVVYREGSIIAADMQGTWMPVMEKIHKNIRKLVQIGGYSVVGFAGIPTVLKNIRNIKTIFDSWNNFYGKEITPDGQFNILSRQLPFWMGNDKMPIGLILAAFDTEYQKGRIFQIEFTISIEFGEDDDGAGFTAIGSGAKTALDQLEGRGYSIASSYEEALRMVYDALLFSHKKNAAVGDTYFAYQVTARGVKDISEEINSQGRVRHA